MKNKELTIIAGPCSIDQSSISEIYDIAKIEVDGKRAIAGTRIVGLKSRTGLDKSGNGMGMDYHICMKNLDKLLSGGNMSDFEQLPSTKIAEQINADTGMIIASEMLMPLIQLASVDGKLRGKYMPWNASVDQLGWSLLEIAKFASKNDWMVGIKNGKWTGEKLETLESVNYDGGSPLEKTWAGLADYVKSENINPILIHRGVDVPEKNDFRNALVHNAAKRTKVKTGAKLYFDPSHSYGPKLREDIVKATINAMSMTIDDENYLYDGILIEAGTSQTDTEQHITIRELADMAKEIGKFRNLVAPSI